MHITPLFAHGSSLIFVSTQKFFVVGVCALAGFAFVTHLFLRDAIRLGRVGIPWLWIAVIAASISGTTFYLAGPWGLSAGLPLLLFFALGRCLAKKTPTKPPGASGGFRPSVTG